MDGMEDNQKLSNPQQIGKAMGEQIMQAQKDFEEMKMAYQSQAQIQGYHTGYSSPREYLHNFLLQAQNAGCNVESYIRDEIDKMLVELKR
jgi:hypothetical protein